MDKVWLLALGLGSLAVLIGVTSAYVYSQPLAIWRSTYGMCGECYGMMGPMHGYYGQGDYQKAYPYGYGGEESNNLTPDVEVTLYTTFENGRFFFRDEAGNTNPTITVKTGDVVRIRLVNSDGITHNIAIPALGVYSSTVSSKGASTSIAFEASEPGEYSYFCTIPGHKEAGMLGKLIIIVEYSD